MSIWTSKLNKNIFNYKVVDLIRNYNFGIDYVNI